MFLHDWLSERALIGEEGYSFATFEMALLSTLQVDPFAQTEEKEQTKEKEKEEKEADSTVGWDQKIKVNDPEPEEGDTMSEEEVLALMKELAHYH